MSRVPPPRSRSSNAVFQFLVETLDGYNACKRYNCSFQCELDGKAYPCHGHGIVLKNLTQNQEHYFLLNVTTNKGERNSSVYSWFIAITSEETYTSGKRVAIDITFSELCTGLGGFKCQNSTNSDVVASSFQIIKPGFKYSLDLILSSKNLYGHAVISMVENICADQAGNKFMRTNGSTLIIHFGKKTSNGGFLDFCMIIFLDFSIPIRNSTEQILRALHVNSSILTPFHDRSNEARRFSFMLNNISRTEIITIELQATSILGRTGIPVSPVAPITFLFDSMRPSVALRTSSLSRPRDSDINIIAEFTKPVFGFDASMIEVLVGRLTRLQDLSRALYSLTVHAESENEVSVTIPAGKVTDISGNENLASNQLVFKHYSAPAICIALYSFVSAGTIATSLIAAMVLLSSANLEAINILALGGANCPTSNPSMNLNMNASAKFEKLSKLQFYAGGSTRGGIITGVLLLAIPAAFILSVSLFIIIVINSGKFAQYKEFNKVPNQEVWYKKLWFLFVGKPTTGKWFYRDGLPSSFLSGFGILFDNCKGSPALVLGDQHELNTMTKWTESGQSGNERIKGVNSEDSNEENKNSIFRRVLGCMQQYYIILDLLRRVGMGMISVAYPPEKTSKSLFALVITLVQFIYLFTIKPYISRSVHVVESVSLLCEAAYQSMVCYGKYLIKTQPQTNSLRHGLKLAAKGLILPFLPKKHWPSVVSTFSQTETEQLSVNPASSGTELGRRKRAGYMDPVSAMTATVVPVQSPHTPSPNVIERRDPRNSKAATNAHIEVEGIWLTGHKTGINDELKMLRELAKAGFSRDDRVDEASTSYTLDAQPPSDEHYLGIPKPRY
ncbi:hypothetical protein AHAS_Ahas16G0298700 [Arachis hypogaea]